jgi:hypothetical protein
LNAARGIPSFLKMMLGSAIHSYNPSKPMKQIIANKVRSHNWKFFIFLEFLVNLKIFLHLLVLF